MTAVNVEKASIPIALLFLGTVAGYPLATILADILGIENRIVSSAFRLGFLVLAIWLFLEGLFIRATIFYSGWFWPTYIGFYFLYAIRLYWDCFVLELPTAYPPEIYFLILIGSTLVPSLAFARRINLNTSRLAMTVTLGAVLFSQFGFFLSNREAVFLSSEGQRVQTDTLNAITFGMTGGVAIIISLFMLIGRTTEAKSFAIQEDLWAKKPVKALLLGIIALGFYTIFLSGSRGPLLAIFVVFLILIFFPGKQSVSSRLGIFFHAGVIGFALVTLFVTAYSRIGEVVAARLDATVNREELSDVYRFQLWEDGFNEFLESPLLGSGFEVSTIGFYPHNLPLEAFMSTGLIGGSLWLVMYWTGLVRAVRVLQSGSDHAWISVVVIYLFSNSLFTGNLWASGPIAHFMVALFAIPVERAAA